MKNLTNYLTESILFKLNGNNKWYDKVSIFDTIVPIKDKDDKYHPEFPAELILIINDKLRDDPKFLDLTDVDVSKMTSLRNVGYGAGGYGTARKLIDKLEEVDITGWNTSNVTDIHGFFTFCRKLKHIKGLEEIDVSNVKDADYALDSDLDNDLSRLNFRNGIKLDLH